jgi:CII-binding regulator of phage lambda lysogenization HflD
LMQKLASENGVAQGSSKYQLMMAHVEELHTTQMDSSSTAAGIMKTRELITTLEDRITRLSGDQTNADTLSKTISELDHQLDVLDHMNENFISLDRQISAIQKSLTQ